MFLNQFQISNLKLALEKKEAEVEQWKAGNARSNMTESQKSRAVSPFHMPRYGTGVNFKPEANQQSNYDNKVSEVNSFVRNLDSSLT